MKFFKIKEEQDPFPHCFLLDTVDSVQPEEVKAAINNTVELASINGLPDDKLSELEKLVLDHTDLFPTSFSSGPRPKPSRSRSISSPMLARCTSSCAIIHRNNVGSSLEWLRNWS